MKQPLKSGDIFISKHFPKTKLKMGYAWIYSENQKAWVTGATDSENNYYTAVPICDEEGKLLIEIIK